MLWPPCSALAGCRRRSEISGGSGIAGHDALMIKRTFLLRRHCRCHSNRDAECCDAVGAGWLVLRLKCDDSSGVYHGVAGSLTMWVTYEAMLGCD